MTLTAHAIVGAAAAQLFPSNPVLAFSAGFVSHFAIDAIPHWDYQLLSTKKDGDDPLNDTVTLNKKFLVDLTKVGFDFCLGVFISLLIFPHLNAFSIWPTALGIIGGVLPDPLQFFYWVLRREPLASLYRFHVWVHTGSQKLKIPMFTGVVLQSVFVLGIFLIVGHSV